jgi:hypothetical protein
MIKCGRRADINKEATKDRIEMKKKRNNFLNSETNF